MMLANPRILCHSGVSQIQFRRFSSLSHYLNNGCNYQLYDKNDPDLEIFKKCIKVPQIHHYNKQSAAMFVQKIDGIVLSQKYGSNFDNYPNLIKEKISNLKYLALQCNLDLSNLQASDMLIDRNDRIWIVGFQNMDRITYN